MKRVIVLSNKLGKSSKYEIAGVTASELGCNQSDVTVVNLTKEEFRILLNTMERFIERAPDLQPGDMDRELGLELPPIFKKFGGLKQFNEW